MNNLSIQAIQGDITKISVDAIVNAANNTLLGGGGVDGAIHRAGGPAILEACRKLGGCDTGEAVITVAGNLPARFVIHTVGPVWHNGKRSEDELLANAYRNSLKRAKENKLKTISFPNISTGVYGFPKERAAKIAISTVSQFLNVSKGIEIILFVCFDEENFRIYKHLLDQR